MPTTGPWPKTTNTASVSVLRLYGSRTAAPSGATTTNAAGDPIIYPDGTAEIFSWIATVEPGGQSAPHQHPVPIYVYVTEGAFEVELDGAERIPMPEGQGILEPQNRNRQVFNVGDGAGRLLVVALGAQGQPISADPQ